MIRAVVFQETGSGIFINPSQGIFIQGTISLPEQPGPITGNEVVCSGSDQTYSIDEVVGATSYSWTIPEGWTGNSESNQISVTTVGVGGPITVSAINQYGSSLPSVLDVIVQLIPDPPAKFPEISKYVRALHRFTALILSREHQAISGLYLQDGQAVQQPLK
jgi:hypothetical protein